MSCVLIVMLACVLIECSVLPVGWDKTVHDHLKALASNPVETLWPRDTLFKYVGYRLKYVASEMALLYH